MKYKAILFDMDGTLLPMDYNTFTKGYFKLLAGKLSPIGIEPEQLINAVWAGTKAMVKNDGTKLNREVFWNMFAQATGKDYEPFLQKSDEFYLNEFEGAKAFTGENPLAKKAVELARKTGAKVICATNPIFPLNGQLKRLSWVNLGAEDFDNITSYESEHCSKPNPKYYLNICEKIGVEPEECLMIGNDVVEDMKAGSSVGMDCFLVTDWAIMNDEWNGRKGTFEELVAYLEELQ